ncbi:GNAT family N-acetyltransferase [Actinomadura nitritigenes]|uniref:GNAT family N-acetyltransferase n=1 Tax=Actinomadura nitritigenes TaxID=134602 RepID=UPI0036CE9C8B
MGTFLTTDRLLLRHFTAEDADHLVALDGDPRVMRFLTNGKPTPRTLIENDVLPRILRRYGEGPLGQWAAHERATGDFTGWFALTPVDGSGPDGSGPYEAELGYRLRAAHWGRGYATEASRALIRKAFTELGVQRITAQTMAVNTASRRVMEKAGLTHVRTFHLHWDDPIPGTEHGEVEYEIVLSDWLRNAQR